MHVHPGAISSPTSYWKILCIGLGVRWSQRKHADSLVIKPYIKVVPRTPLLCVIMSDKVRHGQELLLTFFSPSGLSCNLSNNRTGAWHICFPGLLQDVIKTIIHGLVFPNGALMGQKPTHHPVACAEHQVGGSKAWPCSWKYVAGVWPTFLPGVGWVVPKDKSLTSQQVRSDLGALQSRWPSPQTCVGWWLGCHTGQAKPMICITEICHHQTCFPSMKCHAEPQPLQYPPMNACLNPPSCGLCLALPPWGIACSLASLNFPLWKPTSPVSFHSSNLC